MIATTVLVCAVLLSVASVLAVWRLMRGPTILDRIIGFDMLTVCTIGLVVLSSVWWKTHMYIEMMIIFSLLGFIGTVAFVTYLHSYKDRHDVTPGQGKEGEIP
jgi:multisubunit Na+/H+ antiporter MnhF subunit